MQVSGLELANGRVAGVRRAYEAYPEKAEAYRAFLAEQGYNVEGMQRPVLINRRVTNLDETARAQFNAELNGRTTASLGAVERVLGQGIPFEITGAVKGGDLVSLGSRPRTSARPRR